MKWINSYKHTNYQNGLKKKQKISIEYTTKEIETVIKILSKKKVQDRQFLW